MARKRDYKAEYARRQERAHKYGYSSYSQHRRVKHEFRKRLLPMIQLSYTGKLKRGSLKELGITLDDILDGSIDEDSPDYWVAYREAYGRNRG